MRNFSKFTAVVFAAVAVLVLSTVTFARGWTQMNGQWYYLDGSNEVVTNSIKTSGTTKYYLGEDGAMVTNTFVEDYNDYSYYFGANGAMVTNTWVAVDPAILSSADDDAPSAYWFYFGTNGKAYKASGQKTVVVKTIDGRKYAFDENAHMLTGWIHADDGKISEDEDDPYKEATYFGGGENDGVLRTGWHAYTDGVTEEFDMNAYGDDSDGSGFDPADADVLWFYFQPANCKKLASNAEGSLKTKKINGKTYAFTNPGFMFEGWTKAASVAQAHANYYQRKYYNGAAGGNLVKKGWIYDVPSETMNVDDYNDEEERFFYADGSGKTVVNSTKKVNGKYYIFDKSGIMKKGLVVTTSSNKYIATVKLDETDGKRFIAHNMFVIDDKSFNAPKTSTPVPVASHPFDGTTYYNMYADWDNNTQAGSGISNRTFYFNDDGARVNGTVTLEFADNDYTYVSNNSGGYVGGKNNNSRFYANGLALRANPDVKYGIVARDNKTRVVEIADPDKTLANKGTGKVLLQDVINSGLKVVTSAGSKIKKNAIKKDGNDNYWVITDAKFTGVYSVQMKRANSGYYQFRSDFYKNNGDSTTGWGWCYDRRIGGSHNSAATDVTASYAANNEWCYDVNNKTAVWPMMNAQSTAASTVYEDYTTAITKINNAGADMDFNATLDDDMAVDFYWADSEK